MNNWLKNTPLVAQNMKYSGPDRTFTVIQLEAGSDRRCHMI